MASENTWSSLVLVIVYCLTTPSHYLSQWWLTIDEILRHLPQSNFIRNSQCIDLWYEFGNYNFKITGAPPRGQYVKTDIGRIVHIVTGPGYGWRSLPNPQKQLWVLRCQSHARSQKCQLRSNIQSHAIASCYDFGELILWFGVAMN